MKKSIITSLLIILISIPLNFISQSDEYGTLMKAGIELHDNGKYKKAIKKYDEAYKLNEKNIAPLYEKANSYIAWKKYKKAIKMCELCEKVDPDSETMKYVYTCKANSYDLLKKPEKALEIFKEGINKFPNYYQLHFNKGITEIQNGYYDECEQSFMTSIKLNPSHAGSHNALGRLMSFKKEKLPQIFLISRYLIIDPTSPRAVENIKLLETAFFGNVEKTGKNSTSITLDIGSLGDSTAEKEPNDFSSTELILSLSAAMRYSEVSEGLNDAEILANIMETMCSSLKEGTKEGTGYYWTRFAPYFIEMKEKNLLKTFSYIAYGSSKNKKIKKWLKNNAEELKKFYKWNKEYKWN